MATHLAWVCKYYCLEPIENNGYLYVADKQIRIWYTQRYSQQKVSPAKLVWKPAHERCYLPSHSDYRVSIDLCRTLSDFYLTGIRLGDAVPWFRESNWWELIDLQT